MGSTLVVHDSSVDPIFSHFFLFYLSDSLFASDNVIHKPNFISFLTS